MEVVSTNPGNPGSHRDVQGSLALKVAFVAPGVVLHGATLHHVVAPVHAVVLGVFFTLEDVVAQDGTARVSEEGFL